MAALPDSTLPEVVELSRLSAAELDPLFNEEVEVWDRSFSWDFRPSADLLRRFVQIQSLSGFALKRGHELLGYAYHVCEEHKGLIGDFFVRGERGGNPRGEVQLLSAMVQDLMLTPGVKRIESQLMLLHPAARPLPFAAYLKRHDRFFMETTAKKSQALAPATPSIRASFHPWMERYQEEIAHLIAASYRGHVDSEINDQYRTIPGARRFLMNIIKYPGCGRFLPACSLVCIDEGSGRLCGVCLSSLVSPNAGHITQLCVLPGVRGAHIGYELIRQAMVLLAHLGCRSTSLTVTCSNAGAIRLYRSIGFEATSTFPALVWEGF